MKKTKKKRTWLKVIGIVVGLFIIGGGVFAYSVYHSLSKTVETMHTPIDRETKKRVEPLVLDKKEPFSVLLLGVDERKGDRGRSDSMIVLLVNPEQDHIKMLSIPRDTRTNIVGHGTVDKINHAYAFGGVEMSMDTVEEFLDIPIDYYIKVNMESFKDIVDAVGGVTVENNLDFTYEGKHFTKGTLTLNGQDALKYSRMRYEDPNGDFGRQARQRSIIASVIKKGASLSSLTNYDEIFDAMGKNIQTNLTFDEMKDIQLNYKAASKKVEQATLKGTGTKISGVYYYQVADDEKTRVQGELKGYIGLK